MLDKILELTIDGQKQDLFTNPADTLKEIQKVIYKHQDEISVSVEIKTFFTNSDIRETLEEYDSHMDYDRWGDTVREEAELQENFLEYLQEISVQDYDVDPSEYLLWIIETRVDLPF
tara:strand:- start:62 stop:412 length:351 start_codon:yes stop_codon:yes gene_type:complete